MANAPRIFFSPQQREERAEEAKRMRRLADKER